MSFINYFILFTFILIIGCQKDDLEGIDKKYFKLTLEDGRKYSAKYIDLNTAFTNGTFRVIDIDSNRILISVIFDNLLFGRAAFETLNKEKILTNIIYDNYSKTVPFVVYDVIKNNANICQNNNIECKKEMVFTAFNHPGRIAGTLKMYDSSGTKILATSEFDFISK